MALKGLVGKLSAKITDSLSGGGRGPWQPAAGPFPRLISIDEAVHKSLKGKSGLLVLWHRGVRPQWIFAGCAADLSAILAAAQDDDDVGLYDLNDGVYAAWALLPVAQCPGAVAYLRGVLEPALTETPLAAFGPVADGAKPVEVHLPAD